MADTYLVLGLALLGTESTSGFLWWLVACVTVLQTGFLLLMRSASQYTADLKAKQVSIFSSDYALI